MGVCYSSNSKSSNCKPEHKQSATVNTDYINISDLTIKEGKYSIIKILITNITSFHQWEKVHLVWSEKH